MNPAGTESSRWIYLFSSSSSPITLSSFSHFPLTYRNNHLSSFSYYFAASTRPQNYSKYLCLRTSASSSLQPRASSRFLWATFSPSSAALTFAHALPSMDHPRFPIRLRRGHRINHSCLPEATVASEIANVPKPASVATALNSATPSVVDTCSLLLLTL